MPRKLNKHQTPQYVTGNTRRQYLEYSVYGTEQISDEGRRGTWKRVEFSGSGKTRAEAIDAAWAQANAWRAQEEEE